VFGQVGFAAAIAESFTVSDNDGIIEIRFSHGTENPAVKGIEIVPVDDGEPQPGSLTADPSAIDFGEVEVDQTGTASTTLTNPGDLPVEVTGVTITGSAAYTVTTELPITIGPGQSADLAVSFSPAAVGAFTATVDVEHDGDNSPVAIALSGTGVTPPEPSDVVYRVNAGGPQLDGEPLWEGDTTVAPSPYVDLSEISNTTYDTSQSSSTGPDVDMSHPSIPAGRRSRSSSPSGSPMRPPVATCCGRSPSQRAATRFACTSRRSSAGSVRPG
jgi:hypothetical protein